MVGAFDILISDNDKKGMCRLQFERSSFIGVRLVLVLEQ